MGWAIGSTTLKRITPSEVVQKLLVPVFADSGMATTTYSLQRSVLQVAFMLKRYPDLLHQAPDVQLEFPSVLSIRSACSADGVVGALGFCPSDAKSRAKLRAG